METMDKAPRFSFPTKEEAKEFCTRLREDGFKYDVVTIADVIRRSGNPVPKGILKDGYHYGYSRKTIKKFKPVSVGSGWIVQLPIPGKMVRDKNGYWTTDERELMDIPDMPAGEVIHRMMEQLEQDAGGG